MSKNLSELSGRKGLRENLFEELGIAATETGAVTKQKAEKLAEEFLLGKANVYGAATFYDFLRPENHGKKVYVCNGSSCLTAGTQDKLKDKLKSAVIVLASSSDGKVSLAAGVTADLINRIKAGDLVNHVASQVGGKGGGKPDMAMAGGTDASQLPKALASVKEWVASKIA